MQTLLSLVIASMIGVWVAAIAILSVQNATPVALHVLTYSTIQMPIGVTLAFCSAIGIICGALTYPFRGRNG
jgi:uncharacterized integral membrane protein